MKYNKNQGQKKNVKKLISSQISCIILWRQSRNTIILTDRYLNRNRNLKKVANVSIVSLFCIAQHTLPRKYSLIECFSEPCRSNTIAVSAAIISSIREYQHQQQQQQKHLCSLNFTRINQQSQDVPNT